jgi:hypothetical protein
MNRRHFAQASFAAAAAGFAWPAALPAQGQPKTRTIASVLDFQFSAVEKNFMDAVEAMPDDKYSFAPSGPGFAGVRTFAQQIKHVGVYNYRSFMAMLGQMPPKDGDNGPDNLTTKRQIVPYIRESYVMGHKAIAAINAGNLLSEVKNSPEEGYDSPLALVTFVCWHSYDHYGQMVEYLRMNQIVPPASRGTPLANPAR